jgi:5-methylcytosine-specific restriction endonuclease McrA
VRSQTEWEAVHRLIASDMNDCAIARATGIPRETVRDWRQQGMSSHECDRVNSTSAGVMERQTSEPQKLVGASPCGFESHLRHHSNRRVSARRRWSDDQLVTAVSACISVRAVLQRLGLNATGANYKTIQSTITRLRLDTSHFLGRGHLKGKSHNWSPCLPLDVVLVANSTYTSIPSLKRRLLAKGLLQRHCSECGLTDWRGAPLALVLDHINGDPRDHRLGNLRLLCPNCNSQTPTFAGRNKRLRRLTATH